MRRGYLRVLREHRDFRRLYAARTVSLLGDWFNLLALIALLREVRGDSASSVAWVLILKLLPVFVLGPVAGVVADRFSRKGIMIASDLGRFFGVGALLLAIVVPEATAALVYTVTLVQHAMATFFEPARTASIPNLVPDRDLAAANALGAVTWSVMFTLGASLGGVITAFFGWEVAIALDALTYLLSAWLVSRVRLPRRPRRGEGPTDLWTITGVRDVLAGAAYVIERPRVMAAILVKAGWGVAGAITLVLTVFGQRIYPLAGSSELGVALLWFCRALGTGLGPILSRAIARDDPARMSAVMIGAFLLPVAAYLGFAATSSLALAALMVIIAHLGGSTLWVFSTVLLQRYVEDDFRGRVFAAELGLATLTFSASIHLYGKLLDRPDADPRPVVVGLALSLLAPAILWALASRLFVGARRS